MSDESYNWCSDSNEEDSDPFATDDEDEEYVPIEMESSESDEEDYNNNDDNNIEFLNQEEREEIYRDCNIAFLSKDKNIQYSIEPPHPRPTASSLLIRSSGMCC